MASTLVLAENKVKETEIQVVGLRTGGLSLGLGVLLLVALTAAWGAILVAFNVLNLRLLGR